MRLTGEGILGPPKDRATALGSSYAVLWSWASHWNHFSSFLAYAENGIQSDPPELLDTVNVPYGNCTVDLIIDFTDHLIRGMSLFHCHLLSHEDKGMMAKILFE
jgi:FtsP/CotA-like multicopper oxidase with cupredoxin domain